MGHHLAAEAPAPDGVIEIDQVQEGDALPEEIPAQDADDPSILHKYIHKPPADAVRKPGEGDMAVILANALQIGGKGGADIHGNTSLIFPQYSTGWEEMQIPIFTNCAQSVMIAQEVIKLWKIENSAIPA